jgi:hypothetical protein
MSTYLNNEKILYFPYINIPNEPWMYQSILYWDTVGIIVPPSFSEMDKPYTTHIHQFILSGLITQEFTYEYAYNRNTLLSLLQYHINKPSYNISKRIKNFQDGNTFDLFEEKFSDDILYILEEAGLAKQIKRSSIYKKTKLYSVEKNTAYLMMTLLAFILGKNRKYTPATDSIEWDLITSGVLKSESNQDVRSSLLAQIMPYPISEDIFKVAKFKELNADKLISFRRRVEEIVFSASLIENEEDRQMHLDLKVAEINNVKKELIAKMNENKFMNIAYGALKGSLIDAGIAFITGDPITLAATTLNTIKTISSESSKDIFGYEEIAYLALLEKKLAKK